MADRRGSGKRSGTDLSQLHVGLEFVGGTLIFAGLGWWLDGVFGTEPWLVLLGGGLGFCGGMYLLVKEAMKANRAASKRFSDSARGGSAGGSASPTEPENKVD